MNLSLRIEKEVTLQDHQEERRTTEKINNWSFLLENAIIMQNKY